jgi:hypothetical protein
LLIFQSFILIVYSQQPTQEWVKRYTDTSAAQWDATSIKIDSLGFIYVLAESGNDFGFLKYNSSGNLILVASYWPGGFDNGYGNYFEVTPQGNVYITGGVAIGFNTWIYTVKYNTNGVFQWGKLYNRDNIDEVTDIKVDKSNNVIVIGGSQSYGFTIKYNSSGDTLWTRYSNVTEQWATYNRNVALDDTDNIYIAGNTSWGHGRSLILKYNTFGNLIWNTTFAIDTTRSNLTRGISLDISGNIYVIGTQSVTGGGIHNYILKLGNGGNIFWNAVFNGVNDGQVSGIPVGPKVSSDGSSIYYSTSTGVNNGSQYRSDIATLKYNSSGDSEWVRLYQGSSQQVGAVNASYGIKLDKYGNVYVCGTADNQTTGTDFTSLKYLPNGIQQWVTTYSGVITNSGDYAQDLFIDTNLNVYVTGSDQNLQGGIDAITIKYSQPIGISNNSSELPVQYKLFQNFPNPFNASTVITYQLPKESEVELLLFNSLGQIVKRIENKKQLAGTYSVMINMDNFSSGVYFYSLRTTNNFQETRKLILIK